MTKQLISLGLMSGTSSDGVDASIIQSDGENEYKPLYDSYFEYDQDIFEKIHTVKERINNSSQLKSQAIEINDLEKKITLFHAKVIKEIINNSKKKIDIIGFHGQTIFHDQKEKISKQLGDAKLLLQLVNKKIIYNFRENDLNNGGSGAPLSPVFHKLIAQKNKIELPLCILNIGGISNITIINKFDFNELISKDIGPGNCLIDEWMRKNSNSKFDKNGEISKTGTCKKIILDQAQELFMNRFDREVTSFDTKDFDISFVRGLSLEDGAATLTEFTAKIIAEALNVSLKNINTNQWKVLLCGGGRKNKNLIDLIKNNMSKKIIIDSIDKYNINGDYVESQAFAYIAIRSYLNLPISFPKTTGCIRPCSGGTILGN